MSQENPDLQKRLRITTATLWRALTRYFQEVQSAVDAAPESLEQSKAYLGMFLQKAEANLQTCRGVLEQLKHTSPANNPRGSEDHGKFGRMLVLANYLEAQRVLTMFPELLGEHASEMNKSEILELVASLKAQTEEIRQEVEINWEGSYTLKELQQLANGNIDLKRLMRGHSISSLRRYNKVGSRDHDFGGAFGPMSHDIQTLKESWNSRVHFKNLRPTREIDNLSGLYLDLYFLFFNDKTGAADISLVRLRDFLELMAGFTRVLSPAILDQFIEIVINIESCASETIHCRDARCCGREVLFE